MSMAAVMNYLKFPNKTEPFFGVIQDALPYLNHTFKTTLSTFIRYKNYITNAIHGTALF